MADNTDDIMEWVKTHMDIELAPWQERLARQIFESDYKVEMIWNLPRRHGR